MSTAIRVVVVPVVVGVLAASTQGWEQGVFAGLFVAVLAIMFTGRSAADWIAPAERDEV